MGPLLLMLSFFSFMPAIAKDASHGNGREVRQGTKNEVEENNDQADAPLNTEPTKTNAAAHQRSAMEAKKNTSILTPQEKARLDQLQNKLPAKVYQLKGAQSTAGEAQ